MAHTDVKKTFVGVPKVTGGIWLYPQTVALPTDPYSPRPAGGKYCGGVSDEGYTYTSERQSDKKRDWNGDKVRSIQTSKDDTFEATLIEFLNPVVQEIMHGAGNVTVTPPDATHGTIIATRSLADVLDHGAYIIDTFDGKVKRRRVIPDAQPDKIDPIAEKPGDWTVSKVTWDIFPDSQGVTSYTYTELGDKLVPTEWLVTLTDASGGTWTAKVDGGSPTSGIAQSATNSAVKSAIEALAEVGAGNATVTGSSGGPYTITLSKGGVLTVVGSGLTPGGATISVVPAP